MTPEKTRKKIIIDPAAFSGAEWVEAFYADDDYLLKTDIHDAAKPVKATRQQIIDLAGNCRSKADRVEEDDDVDACGWADDLRGAAGVLERLAGVESPDVGKRVRLAPRELATVLAALRAYQAAGCGAFSVVGQEQAVAIADIAADAGDPLDAKEIDALCERINCA